MGADIIFERENKIIITGVKSLQCNTVSSTDLRASMALIVAALSARGSSLVKEVEFADRGYANLDFNLLNCGANFARRVTKREDTGFMVD